MSDPVATFVRNVVRLPSGATAFTVSVSVTDPGDLPYPEWFVLTIADPLNPKTDVLARVVTPYELRQLDGADPLYVKVDAASLVTLSGDTFARLANVNDLTDLPRDRAVAVQRGATEYLVRAVTLSYDNITTADAAWRTLVKRLSDLVATWRQYRASFATSPDEGHTLPEADAGVEAALVAAYKAARDARLALAASRDDLKAQKTACETDCAADRALLGFLLADVAALDRAKQRVTALTETGSTNAKTFALNGADPDSYETLLAAKRAALASQSAVVSACEENCRALGQRVADAEASVVAAQATENGALASVLAVCPTFSPGSV